MPMPARFAALAAGQAVAVAHVAAHELGEPRLGAAVGPGTVMVFLLLGPAVDLFRRTFVGLERASERSG